MLTASGRSTEGGHAVADNARWAWPDWVNELLLILKIPRVLGSAVHFGGGRISAHGHQGFATFAPLPLWVPWCLIWKALLQTKKDGTKSLTGAQDWDDDAVDLLLGVRALLILQWGFHSIFSQRSCWPLPHKSPLGPL